MLRRLVALMASVFLGLVWVVGCGGSGAGSGSAGAPLPRSGGKAVLLNGAGATFPYPLYSRWMDEYSRLTPNVRINYQSIGSGGGIEQISKRVIDFGASDAPLTDEMLKKMPGEILHIPTVLGAVSITYNLPGIKDPVKFSPDVLADIFLGRITKWDDPRIVALNPGLRLPSKSIVVVHRSDGSGTTNMFTDYLSKISPAWKEQVGMGTSVNWPVGVGAKGSEGVSRQLQSTTGAIGYVELSYALLNNLPYALIQNRAGKFVAPSLETTTAAAAGAASSMPDDLRVSIVNAPGENAYPIAGFTYILVFKEQADPDKGRALAKFLWWAVHDGERMAPPLAYGPLPPEVLSKVEQKLKSMTAQGQPLLAGP
ncbi:phosphate ABC transporter substrate-binding protein PstS [Kyrpidia sp.]|uniref:phosphate ABC transporter substrate-binding protein PstS n=1 Tax=Kyrpidia sp. TaxID=2073077 RepID=UPI00258936B4|nr:phosphate ABC transporter substrate-binding protein PstS [Kyrpidia sp.]